MSLFENVNVNVTNLFIPWMYEANTQLDPENVRNSADQVNQNELNGTLDQIMNTVCFHNDSSQNFYIESIKILSILFFFHYFIAK